MKILKSSSRQTKRTATKKNTNKNKNNKIVFILVLLLVVNSLSFLRVHEKRVSRVAERRKIWGREKCRKHVSPFPLSLFSGSY